MGIVVGTHSGTFHADDVLAFALLRLFVDDGATVRRSRDPEVLDACDIVIDVGGRFDPAAKRFDHHQATYTGPLSSAGMICDWLEAEGTIDAGLAQHLRAQVVDYVDAVDTGAVAPDPAVPCFARLVEALGYGRHGAAAQLEGFLAAVEIALPYLRGLMRGHEEVVAAERAVGAAMDDAVAAGRNVLFLDRYHRWKPVYFARGGTTHPTDYVVFPSDDGTWKVTAIPPTERQFEQKRSLPASWAGLMGEELSAATGVPGSVFCHKNRFIAVFQTRDGLVEALKRGGVWREGSAA